MSEPYVPRVEVERDDTGLVLMTKMLFEFLIEGARAAQPDQILEIAYGKPETKTVTYFVPVVSGRGKGPTSSG